MFRRTRVLVAAVACVLVAGCGAGPPHSAAHRSPVRTASPSPAGPRTLTVLGAGDVLVHTPIWKQAEADAKTEGRTGLDFGPILASVKPTVSAADLAICHVETPLAPENGPYRDWPLFAAPPQAMTAVRQVGFDDCSTASNHSYDQGGAGVDRTLDTLDRLGLRHSGTARTPAEANRPDITTVRGVKVAQLSYTFGLNVGVTLPADQSWRVNVIDVPRILAAAHAARAAIVILSLHWGTEYQQAPTETQVDQARALLASPDLPAARRATYQREYDRIAAAVRSRGAHVDIAGRS